MPIQSDLIRARTKAYISILDKYRKGKFRKDSYLREIRICNSQSFFIEKLRKVYKLINMAKIAFNQFVREKDIYSEILLCTSMKSTFEALG